MKQTAVEWIEGYLKKFNHIQESLSLRKAFEQAKEMEKEQIIDACIYEFADDYDTAIEYYYETFKSE
jgi:Tfp pilus assembly protein PilF